MNRIGAKELYDGMIQQCLLYLSDVSYNETWQTVKKTIYIFIICEGLCMNGFKVKS